MLNLIKPWAFYGCADSVMHAHVKSESEAYL